MINHDVMAVVFLQVPPSEASFRYLTFLACVCKVWKECANNTRENSIWLLPFHSRGKSYQNALKNAKSDLSFDAFTSGMVEYFSCQNIQETILELMFESVEESWQEKLAIKQRFRSADTSSLLSNLVKIFKSHMKSVLVFVATFKIVGILSLMDRLENSTARTSVIAACDFFRLIIEGAVLHKDTMNVLQCDALIKALLLAPTGDVGNIAVFMGYLQSFPASANLQDDTLLYEYRCRDDFSLYYMMPEVDFRSMLMQAGISFEVEKCKIPAPTRGQKCLV